MFFMRRSHIFECVKPFVAGVGSDEFQTVTFKKEKKCFFLLFLLFERTILWHISHIQFL